MASNDLNFPKLIIILFKYALKKVQQKARFKKSTILKHFKLVNKYFYAFLPFSHAML